MILRLRVWNRYNSYMKKLLFLCVYNSARSQMAEGLARTLGQGKITAFSAGLKATGVNPYAIKVMKEIGIDISSQRSKTIEEYKKRKFDFVITLCSEAEEACPVLPSEAKRLHWPFPDPGQFDGSEAEVLAAFRRVRDALEAKLKDFLAKLSL